ncbi:hypothetical protein ACFVH6_22070 [Spirillospora sp. NPDC127200]
MTEPTVLATRYRVSCLPEDHDLAHAMTITVEYRGHDRYAVLNRMGKALGTDGEWDWEPRPSERDDDWISTHRFDLDTALELAKRAAPLLSVGNRTAAAWLTEEAQ